MADRASEQSIFLHAIGLAGADRAAYLDEACRDDPALRDELAALLAAHDRLGGASPTTNPGSAGPAPAPGGGGEAVAALLSGRYKLLEQIGEGGMGAVWMAQQIDPVKRLVALKVIKPGMDSRQVLARFEAERQALALMDHPNVAKVLDAGTTAGGLPYFVMELVKGVPITRYCDEHRLTPRQRLELFVPVCQAIQHAHTKGIIHRDVKPSNVLVASYDGVPVPKVIDFGIAKAVGAQLTDRTLITGYGSILGTLEYMSPEQAEFNQLDVDARSDVYSLGVLLYELLTGSTPLQKNRLEHGAILEVLRMIREEEPPRPSTRLSESKDSLPTISAQRQTEPAKLTRLVRGELDWIAMTALEKDRERRYETASAFAADVRRYLADEPVLACPPSAGYRLGKFLRRNKRPVLAVGGLALLLVAGVVGTTAGLVLALAAERRAVAERNDKDEALRLTQKALNVTTDEAMGDLLGKQVQLTDKHREFLKTVLSYHEAFAAARADDAEGRQARAEGYYRVGRIRMALGEIKEAEAAHREAVALQEQLADEFPARSDFREALARSQNQHGDALYALGRTEESESAHRGALTLWKQLADDSSDRPEFRQELARSHNRLRDLLRNTGRPEQAEAACQDALAICEKLADEFHTRVEFREDLADCHFRMGELLNSVERKTDAERAYGKALDVRKQLAKDFPGRAEALEGLALSHVMRGVMLAATGRRKEAEDAYLEAVAVGKKLMAKHPNRPEFRQEVALAYQNLSVLFGEAGRARETEDACSECIALWVRLKADYPLRPEFRIGLAIAYESQGNLLRATGRQKQAETSYRAALVLWEGLVAESSRQPDPRRSLAQTQMRLGRLMFDMKHPEKAEPLYHHAIGVGEKLVADFGPRRELLNDLALSYTYLGNLQTTADQPEDAEKSYRKALERWNQLAAKGTNQAAARRGVCFCRYSLSIVLRKLDRRDEALAEYEAAFRGLKLEAEAHRDLADELRVNGRQTEAMAEYRAALRVREDYPEAHVNLGKLLALRDRHDDAIVEFRKALKTKQVFRETYAAHYALGSALLAQDHTGEAIAEFREAVRLNPDFALAHYDLGNAYYADRVEEAIAAYRDATRVQPDYPQAYVNLGNSLGRQGRLLEAIVEYRKALATRLDFPEAHKAHQNLGRALMEAGQLDESVTELRKAVALNPTDATAHFQLGLALQQKGEFGKALDELRHGQRLGSKDPGWPYPDSPKQVRKCERFIEWDGRLPDLLEGKATPTDAKELIDLSELCAIRRLYRAVAHFLELAITRKPELADDLRARYRYNAASAAALAASGQGNDAGKLDDAQRAGLRRQALGWLQGDLAAWSKELERNTSKARAEAGDRMRGWRVDPSFVGLRGKEALARLPQAEAERWQKLWDDVADVLARTQTKTNPKAKPDGK